MLSLWLDICMHPFFVLVWHALQEWCIKYSYLPQYATVMHLQPLKWLELHDCCIVWQVAALPLLWSEVCM